MHHQLSLIGRAAMVAAVMAFGATASVDAIAGGPKHCPPGLAKKGSCTPPGQQKAWKKGDYIPADVEVRIIVNHDRYRVRRPRDGEQYVEIGGRVYLIAEATKRVIEAINLIDKATK